MKGIIKALNVNFKDLPNSNSIFIEKNKSEKGTEYSTFKHTFKVPVLDLFHGVTITVFSNNEKNFVFKGPFNESVIAESSLEILSMLICHLNKEFKESPSPNSVVFNSPIVKSKVYWKEDLYAHFEIKDAEIILMISGARLNQNSIDRFFNKAIKIVLVIIGILVLGWLSSKTVCNTGEYIDEFGEYQDGRVSYLNVVITLLVIYFLYKTLKK